MTHLAQERVQANGRDHLVALVYDAMQAGGPGCSLNHIDVSAVTDMDMLFYGSPFNGDISEWDVSNATTMKEMFAQSSFTGDISRWNTARVDDMEKLFYGSAFNGDISRWNVERVVNAKSMFQCSVFTGDISKWRVDSLQEAEQMFAGSAFRGDISRWQFSPYATLDWMFDIGALTECAQPSLYHWRCAAKDPSVLAGKPQWLQHYNDSVVFGALLGVTVRSEVTTFAHMAWINQHDAQHNMHSALELPDMEL